MAAQQVQKIAIGRHTVTLTPFGGGTATTIGMTKEGVTLTVKRDAERIMVHELGAPVRKIYKTSSVTAKVVLAQYDEDLLALALASAKTTVAGPPAKSSVDLSPVAGLEAPCFKAVFHPAAKAAGDVSDDKVIPCFALDVDQELSFRVDKELNLVISGEALAAVDTTDPTKAVPLLVRGDETTGVLFAAA